jgi:RNA polymerase sigma-70 factor (ECF subfamily)
MRDEPGAGLALIDTILNRGDLGHYPPAHSTRAELCRRLRKTGDARASYERALWLTRQEPLHGANDLPPRHLEHVRSS